MSTAARLAHLTRLAQLADAIATAQARLDIGQNEFARRCRVDPSVLSKLVRGRMLAGPSEKRVRAYLARLDRQQAKAS